MKKLKEALKRVKLRTLIGLIILLVFNAYAWFVFQTKVQGKIEAHIEAWDVQFQAGQEENISEINFEVGKIFPGMVTFEKTIIAHNFGEKKAKLTYEIKKMTILGETYSVDDPGTTSEDLEKLLEEYPFHIVIDISNDILDEESGMATIIVSLAWPYDQGKDALDTEWGEAASDFYEKELEKLGEEEELERADIVSVAVTLELKAVQFEEI